MVRSLADRTFQLRLLLSDGAAHGRVAVDEEVIDRFQGRVKRRVKDEDGGKYHREEHALADAAAAAASDADEHPALRLGRVVQAERNQKNPKSVKNIDYGCCDGSRYGSAVSSTHIERIDERVLNKGLLD